jgi:ribokinase
VVVVGSLNVDTTIRVDRLPAPSETVLGGDPVRSPGGKGGNQAVAAARAGARVEMLGAVGRDADGDASVEALRAEGVGVDAIARVDRPTGSATIAVDRRGENLIVVAPGANASLDETIARHVDGASGVLLASLEVPMTAVTAAMVAAARQGWMLVLNPAPAASLPAELLGLRPILVPNLAEALALTGADTLEAAIASLHGKGIHRLAVTLGADGALVVDGEARVALPSAEVTVVDATGGGDTFCGVLAAWLAGGASFLEAATAANLAAGLSVAQPGARAGSPSASEIGRNLAR